VQPWGWGWLVLVLDWGWLVLAGHGCWLVLAGVCWGWLVTYGAGWCWGWLRHSRCWLGLSGAWPVVELGSS